MALRPYPGFVGPSYTLKSKIAAYDRCMNWFPERIESGTGPSRYWLVPTPGYFPQVTGLDSPGRGGITIAGATIDGVESPTYFVAGSTLYRYPSTVMASGIVNGGGNPVKIVTNGEEGGHQLLFAADSTVYCFDTTSHALTIVGTGHAVEFLNGYGIILNTNTNRFFFSGLFDFTSWSALDVVVREDASDNWVTVLAYREELWLFGTRTTSIYYNADDPDTPWQPNESAFIQEGIAGPYSATIVDGAPMWEGRNDAGFGIIFRASGYSPVRVSTYAVEDAIGAGPDFGGTSDAEGCTYQQAGHVFYELTFPLQNMTWVYDLTEGLWHERGERNALEFQELDTRGFFSGLTLSRTAGTVYSVVATYAFGTNGDPITRLRRAPHLNQAQQRTRYSHFRLLMETGLGLGGVPSTDVGYDPQISLSWSDDGGQTFGASYQASAGRIGAFSQLVEWRQLGQARDRIFELTCSAPIPWRLIDAFLDYSVGSS